MDPSMFATLIGLICNYHQEQGAAEHLDRQTFIGWLQHHRAWKAKEYHREHRRYLKWGRQFATRWAPGHHRKTDADSRPAIHFDRTSRSDQIQRI